MNTSQHRPHRPGFRFVVHGSLTVAALLLLGLAGCSPDAGSNAKAPTPTPIVVPPASDPAVASKGAKVYAEYCANCHYDGAGNRSMPALRGSAVVAAAPSELTKLLLKGQRGVSVVNGQKINAYMPALDYLQDDELAAVVMHVRRKFAGVESKWTAADVKAAR